MHIIIYTCKLQILFWEKTHIVRQIRHVYIKKCPDTNKTNNKKENKMSKSESKTCGCKNCSGMHMGKDSKKDKKPNCDK